MNEYFCVFRRSSVNDLDRRAVICAGGDVLQGKIRLDEEETNVDKVHGALKKLKKKQASFQVTGSRDELTDDDEIKEVVTALEQSAEFLCDEIVESEEVLEEMSQYGMTAWINSENSSEETYFEMKVSPKHIPEVEFACAKIFLSTLRLDLIFLQGSYYCTIADLSTGEQPLNDTSFPDISNRGSGFQLKNYTSQAECWRKLTLWQLLDEHSVNMRDIFRQHSARRNAAEGKMEEKTSSPDSDSEDDEEGRVRQVGDEEETRTRDIKHINEEYLWGKSKEAFGGSYTQTYLMLKPEDPRQVARRALFRYGNWCYGGYIDMDQEVSLHEVPHVLRKFQRQQGKLAYWFEIQNLPDGLPFTHPMRNFAMASAFLEEELTRAEEVLTQITEYHKEKGIPAWIDEENGSQYFELQTSADQAHYEEVELMASKTYFQGVVVITLYFEGSFYVTLSPSVDDQPLLDMSFPDVASKGRALQVATYPHHEFKKLMLWQSQRSVWETANRAVLEQRAREAAQKRALEQAEQQSSTKRHISTDSVESDEESVHDVQESPRGFENGESKSAVESKTSTTPAAKEVTVAISTAARDEDRAAVASSKPLRRGTLEQKQQGSNVRAPHHLKPLASLNASGKLPKLEKGISLDAPWDALGRPKSLFAKK